MNMNVEHKWNDQTDGCSFLTVEVWFDPRVFFRILWQIKWHWDSVHHVEWCSFCVSVAFESK